MTHTKSRFPSQLCEQFVIRFERPGHRDQLKRKAKAAKRSLNKHLLHLIEVAEHIEAQGVK